MKRAMQAAFLIPAILGVLFGFGLQGVPLAHADQVAVVMETLRADGERDVIGGITAVDTPEGAEIKIVVTGFQPGFHAFHLLARANCDPAPEEGGRLVLGGAAGGLYDPANTGLYDGPFGEGYLGALPKTEATPNGWIFMTIIAPRVQVSDLRGKALVVREGDDTYKPSVDGIGGGGPIQSCGLVRGTQQAFN